MHAQWLEGSDHGLVWEHGLAIVESTVPADAVRQLWETFAGGGNLAEFLRLLSVGSGADLLSLPAFAIALRAPSGDWQLAARGSLEVRVDAEVVRGAGISTWAERFVPEGDAVSVGAVDGLADARPIVAGVVPARGLAWGASAGLPVASPADRGQDAVAILPSEDVADAPDAVDASDAVEVPDSVDVLAPVDVSDAVEVPDSVDVLAPVEVPAPSELPGIGVHRASLSLVKSVDESVEPDAAPEASDPAVEPESQPPSDAGSLVAEVAADPEPESAPEPATPAPRPADLETMMTGEVAPVEAADAQDASEVAPAEAPPLGRFARQFGETQMVSVEDAAVRENAPEFIAGVPQAAAPASETGEDEIFDHEDHDGHTVLMGSDAAAQLAAASAAADAAPDPAIVGPSVLGVACVNGHANPPQRAACSECGAPIDGEPRRLARPALGTLLLPNGQRLDLTAPVIVGRNPRADRVQGGTLPTLVPLSQGHISGTHLEIRLEEWNVLAVDLHSTNGTFLRRHGEAPVRLGERPELLIEGDVLDLGHGVQLTLVHLR